VAARGSLSALSLASLQDPPPRGRACFRLPEFLKIPFLLFSRGSVLDAIDLILRLSFWLPCHDYSSVPRAVRWGSVYFFPSYTLEISFFFPFRRTPQPVQISPVVFQLMACLVVFSIPLFMRSEGLFSFSFFPLTSYSLRGPIIFCRLTHSSHTFSLFLKFSNVAQFSAPLPTPPAPNCTKCFSSFS